MQRENVSVQTLVLFQAPEEEVIPEERVPKVASLAMAFMKAMKIDQIADSGFGKWLRGKFNREGKNQKAQIETLSISKRDALLSRRATLKAGLTAAVALTLSPIGLLLENHKSVEAVSAPPNLWYWEGQTIRAFLTNIEGLTKDTNGNTIVDPDDIGVHYNLHIQPIPDGGFDWQNWHIRYYEDANNYYYRLYDNITKSFLKSEDPDGQGLYTYSKFAFNSMEEATENRAWFQIINDLQMRTDLPTGDLSNMVNELMNPSSNEMPLWEMLIPLAEETLNFGNEAVQAVDTVIQLATEA